MDTNDILFLVCGMGFYMFGIIHYKYYWRKLIKIKNI